MRRNMYRKPALIIALVATVFCCTSLCRADTRSLQEPKPRNINADNYEDATLGLDGVAIAAGDKNLIILIARRGNHELSSGLTRRRLKVARDYLRYSRAIPDERIISAEGDAVDARGRIEVYIEGKLFTVFLFGCGRGFAQEP